MRGLIDIGAVCVGYWTPSGVATEAGFIDHFSQVHRVADRHQLLEDPNIRLVTCAAVPCSRATHAIEAMRHGKDFITDKPGVTTFEQLHEVQPVQQET